MAVWLLPGGILALPAADDFMRLAPVEPGTSGERVVVEIVGGASGPIRGFSVAVGHDAGALELLQLLPGPLFADAEWVATRIQNEDDESSQAYGALFLATDFDQPLDRPPVELDGAVVLARLVYGIRPEAPNAPTPLLLRNRAFGRPPVSVIFADAESRELFPELADGEVAIERRGFVRGNCDGRGDVEITDAIFGLGFLFRGESPPPCTDACDANDDGAFDISDAIYTLKFLFVGSSPPLPPYPTAGPDPTADFLGCAMGT